MSGFYLPSENEFDPTRDAFVHPSVSKERRYKHFDLPLSETQRARAIDFGREGCPHRFRPMLGFTDVSRRVGRKADKSLDRKKPKERPIRFACHADAAYLEGYAAYLSPAYERALDADGTSDAVLAYRRGGGTNIHHAKALFDEIRAKGECSVFAMDISGFFDCLDHRLLRDEIAGLINAPRLDGHHGTVWKNITRYSWVETDDLDALLGRNRNGRGRVCSPEDFVTHVQGRKTGLIRTHDQPFGIPQGTPISGLYANIYMRSFDREMVTATTKHGGSYRRYSDDIAVVLPLGAKARHVVPVVEKMLADHGLAMSVEKTETADFSGGELVSDRPIQYLGFTFNGEQTLIRPSSLDAYRAKMEDGIHAKIVAASQKRAPSFEIYKREALSRYTHLGKRRNFLRYAYRAAEVMDAPEIRKQVKPHMTWFNRTWDREIEKVYGPTIITE